MSHLLRAVYLKNFQKIFQSFLQKSRIRETLNLSTYADHRTNIYIYIDIYIYIIIIIFNFFLIYIFFLTIPPQNKYIGTMIRIGREIQCLPYAGFLNYVVDR